MKRDMTSYIRGVIVALMAMVAVFSILAGIGTTCVAFAADKWKPFSMLAPYADVYQAITIITLLVGFFASIITYAFVRGEKWAYLAAVIVILVGIISGGVHMYYSNMLRNSVTPANLRVYVDILALLFLLIIRLPAIWQKLDLTRPMGGPRSYNIPTGAALMAGGLGLLSTPLYTSASHTFEGVNYVSYLLPELYIVGGILVVVATGLFILVRFGWHIEYGLARLWNNTFGRLLGDRNASVKGVK